jgi:anaerobic selenocysteine-containing dehydrogenase
MTSASELLQRARIAEAHVELHPRDAAALGVADGDLVTVHLRNRELQVKAFMTDNMVPGVVLLPRGLEDIPDLPGSMRVNIALAQPVTTPVTG